VIGTVATFGKLGIHYYYRKRFRTSELSASTAKTWERRFFVANLTFAVALGVLAARTFSLSDAGSELLATGMLFGFCSGQVVRISVRPLICLTSIQAAVWPSVAAAAAHGGAAYLGLAVLFALFTVGGMESVSYAYSQTRNRINLNHELANAAGVDWLTGLSNRLGLRQAVWECFDKGRSADRSVAVHCLDLDGFKALNDRYGHAIGDAVLVAIARRVGAALRPDEVAARYGGDEFVMIQWVSHPDEVAIFARRLHSDVTEPVAVGEYMLSVGGSIGCCTGQTGSDDFDDLLAVADRRMYDSKRAGGGITLATAP